MICVDLIFSCAVVNLVCTVTVILGNTRAFCSRSCDSIVNSRMDDPNSAYRRHKKCRRIGIDARKLKAKYT